MLVHICCFYGSVIYQKIADYDIDSVFILYFLVQITPVYFLIKPREIKEAY